MAFVLSRDDARGLALADADGRAAAYIDRLREASTSWRTSSRLGDVTPVVREGARLPWQWWMDGKWWFVALGEDFHVPTDRFMSYVHQRANARGVRAAVRRTESCVVFRFTDVPMWDGMLAAPRLNLSDLV